VLFLLIFLLASRDLYKRKLVEVVGPRLSRQRLTIQILNEIDQQIGRFLLIQVVASAIVGIGVGVSLRLLGLNQAAMWGVAAGVLNSMPASRPDELFRAGTMLHGIFENHTLRAALVEALRERKGLAARAATRPVASREAEYDRLAAAVAASVDLPAIRKITGLG